MKYLLELEMSNYIIHSLNSQKDGDATPPLPDDHAPEAPSTEESSNPENWPGGLKQVITSHDYMLLLLL